MLQSVDGNHSQAHTHGRRNATYLFKSETDNDQWSLPVDYFQFGNKYHYSSSFSALALYSKVR